MGGSKHELDIINMYCLKGICQITPLPSQNAHLSTTVTFFFTGGHFECSCVQPLYKEGVIAVIKMAREIQIVLFMFILVSFLIVSFTIQGNRAAEKCAVCGKTIVGEDGRPASGYKKDFLPCFGIDANTDGKICGRCRKAVTDHRKSGQKFFM